jgi:hypothetical protein
MTPSGSPVVVAGFAVLALALAGAFVAGVAVAGRRLGTPGGGGVRVALTGATVWLGLTWLAAESGLLRRWDATPPPFALFIPVLAALGPLIAWSPLGTQLARGLPLSVLVGSQVFRFPLELLMHRAYEEAVMPGQMSYSGWNFDILTGLSAGILGWWLARGGAPRALVLGWNVAGLALLANVVTIAIVSTPLFRWFGDDRLNVFVAHAPYVWLPAVMVLAAWVGHLLVFRKLAAGP